jgi:hypothetical protein
MNPILEEITLETAEQLAARAKEKGISVDEYLRSLLRPANGRAGDEGAGGPPRNEAMLAVLRRSSERLKDTPIRGSTEETLGMIRDARAGGIWDYEPVK